MGEVVHALHADFRLHDVSVLLDLGDGRRVFQLHQVVGGVLVGVHEEVADNRVPALVRRQQLQAVLGGVFRVEEPHEGAVGGIGAVEIVGGEVEGGVHAGQEDVEVLPVHRERQFRLEIRVCVAQLRPSVRAHDARAVLGPSGGVGDIEHHPGRAVPFAVGDHAVHRHGFFGDLHHVDGLGGAGLLGSGCRLVQGDLIIVPRPVGISFGDHRHDGLRMVLIGQKEEVPEVEGSARAELFRRDDILPQEVRLVGRHLRLFVPGDLPLVGRGGLRGAVLHRLLIGPGLAVVVHAEEDPRPAVVVRNGDNVEDDRVAPPDRRVHLRVIMLGVGDVGAVVEGCVVPLHVDVEVRDHEGGIVHEALESRIRLREILHIGGIVMDDRIAPALRGIEHAVDHGGLVCASRGHVRQFEGARRSEDGKTQKQDGGQQNAEQFSVHL